jgi:eukaryotic-like serine/threonine-protein kinase
VLRPPEAMPEKTVRERSSEAPAGEIRGGAVERRASAASTRSMTPAIAAGEWIPPSKDPALQLRLGLLVRSPLSGRQYRVGTILGAGGFGAAYRVEQVGGGDWLAGSIALKVSVEPRGWYREAYFGDLLREVSGIVRMHEAFAWVPRGDSAKALYCLVSELAEEGDLLHYLESHPEPWPEWKARREIVRLLRAVKLLHASGAVHRDITPNNVFVAPDRVLKLGDFGIASHRMGERDVRADRFTRWFAPPAIRTGKTGSWRQADDVYHLGQLFALLLHGGGKTRLTADDARRLTCTPEAKSVIQRSIGERRKRFATAAEMLIALEKQKPGTAKRVTVRSLEGKRVVFTGPLGIPRTTARRLVKKAGGIVESGVGHLTDVIVVGKQSPHWKAEQKGQKLLDVDHERELGHYIAQITESRFMSLVRARR